MFSVVEKCDSYDVEGLDGALGAFFEQYPLSDLLASVERFVAPLDVTYKWNDRVWRAQLTTRREGYPETHCYLEVRLQARLDLRVDSRQTNWHLFRGHVITST